MPTITFDRFDRGLDRRSLQDTSDPNRLWELKNAFVTSGRTIRKRPGLALHSQVPTSGAGTSRGLKSFGGFLNVFSAIDSSGLGTMPAGVRRWTVSSPNGGGVGTALEKVLFARQFAGDPYYVLRFIGAGAGTWHFYLHPQDNVAMARNTAYSLTERRRSSNDDYRGVLYECTTAGTTGGSDPAWVTTLGATMNDGSAVWTVVSGYVRDANCPQSDAAIIMASRVFAVDGEVVRFTAIDDASDWTTTNEAGFIASGRQAGGDDDALALGYHRGRLVVLFRASAQTWNMDPDPDLMTFDQAIDGVGTTAPGSVDNLAGDVFFRSEAGYRSIAQSAYNEQLLEVDVGSAIDRVLAARTPSSFDQEALFIPGGPAAGGGQYVNLYAAGLMDVYTFSRTGKISAWSGYEFAEAITDITKHEGKFYARADGNILYMDSDTYQDNGTDFEVLVETAQLDFKKPGQLKLVQGCDLVMEGEALVSFKWQYPDPNNPGELLTGETAEIMVKGNTRPDGFLPVECMVTSIAAVFKVENASNWELSAISFHYELLEAIDY